MTGPAIAGSDAGADACEAAAAAFVLEQLGCRAASVRRVHAFATVLVDELAWRIPLYGALWQLVDAIVDHRLGNRVGGALVLAMESLTGARRLGEDVPG